MRALAGWVGVGLACLACLACSAKVGEPTHATGGDGPGSGAGAGAGAGGRSGGNSAGVDGATPTTSNVFVDQIVQTAVDKIDLLFMIDNSVSMADKQEILKAAMPALLGRLVSPICVDGNGNPTTGSSPNCVNGDQPEFAPISDIHIGIVSSSLGAHGGTVCAAAGAGDPADSHLDDKAHLIGTMRTGLASWNNIGFLAWDPAGTKNTPPGESNAANLITNFSAMIEATGQHGCAYEASLESWYRFLIDPEPPAQVVKVNNTTTRLGVDTDLLAQRAAFLRPDSLVAIVMLSDENDCSIRDDGVGWFVGSTARMPKATRACASNPNDACCRSCAQNESSPPAGCAPLSADPVCMGASTGSYNTWDSANDSLNLRCFEQRQRFGFDLLYETQRYVSALTSARLPLQSNPTMTAVNPLYDAGNSGKPPRDPSLVFLVGILGVPWQDIATADSLASPTALTYLSATQLVSEGRWAQILGDPSARPPVPPSDPFMIESIAPRQGTNPNVPVPLSPATSSNPTANVINGHEQNIPGSDDLQYACTFKLATPKVCAPGDLGCDCAATLAGDASAVTAANSPLCQPAAGGPPGTTQYFAKAYPGARELTVLRDFKDNAIVASICPKVSTSANPSQDPNYGYNPAVAGIVSRVKQALVGKCLPRAIAHAKDSSGNDTPAIACSVVEAQQAGRCDCTKPGRGPADPTVVSAVYRQLQGSGSCGSPGQPSCDATGFCLCEISQESGPDLSTCQANAATSVPGFCYIDDPQSPALLHCPSNQKQLLRFVDGSDSAKTPAAGAYVFIACAGLAAAL